jgi:hypothetical protein
MDKTNDAIFDAYKLILENKEGTVGKDMSGQSFEGAKEKGKPVNDNMENAKGDIKKPVAGPSQGDNSVADGKGKPAPVSKDIPKKKVQKEGEEIPLTFDKLYTSILKEEELPEEITPAGDVEDKSFDTDSGDFEEGPMEDESLTGEPEQIDVAQAFRELANNILAIADKLGGGMGEAPAGDEDLDLDNMGEDETGMEGMEDVEKPLVEESASVGKIPEPSNPKVAKKTSFDPKMSKNPKNNIGKSGAGKANTPAGKDRSGTLSKAPETKFGPKMSLTVGGTGPIAKGGNNSFIK